MLQTVWNFGETNSAVESVPFNPGVQNSWTPFFLKLLASRGLEAPAEIEHFLNPSSKNFFDPFLMKGMKEAVARIQKAAAFQEKVLVHGDYDVDGITGSAIVSLVLEKIGVPHETFLPERAKDGYGVSGEAIERAERDRVKLLITVDCGISAKEEIEKAKSAGIDAIILDHHHLPSKGLPPAMAILNPLQEDCNYPFK